MIPSMQPRQPAKWQSRWTFIAAATGAAVGLGNLWRFSYLVGENGGAAYIAVYLACLLFLSLPVLIAEVVIGSRGRANPVDAAAGAALESGLSRHWRIIAVLGLVASVLILAYYSVIGGWVFAYVKAMAGQQFIAQPAREVGNFFSVLLTDTPRMVLWHSVFCLSLWLISSLGSQWGVARILRLLVPLMFIALVLLALYGSKIGDIDSALVFLFQPDWQQVNPEMVLVAMGQAFFTVSIGTGAMMAFGAYMPERHSMVGMLSSVVALDTVIALLAGLAIFPLVFSLNIEPSMGPGLMFVALPYAFGQMVFGDFFGLLFFIMVAGTALSSGLALLEPLVSWLSERLRWWRFAAVSAASGLIWLLGLLVILSLSLWSDWQWLGMGVFAWLEFITANLLLPLGGWLIAVFVGWWLRTEVLCDELMNDPHWLFFLWYAVLRYIAAPAVLLILVASLYQRLAV